jgi:hypothetical protein
VCGGGLVDHLTELGDRSRQIALPCSRPSLGEAALTSDEPITDRIGHLECFLGGHPRRGRVAGYRLTRACRKRIWLNLHESPS